MLGIENRVAEDEAVRVAMPLETPVAAPTIAGIIAEPHDLASREAYPFYAHRSATSEGIGYDEVGPEKHHPQLLRDSVVAYTEADAIFDFNYKMLVAANMLREYGNEQLHQTYADHADILRTDLSFIGHPEMAVATEAIAAHWLGALDKSPEGELNVVLSIDGSSLFVYRAVREALETLSPDALDHLRVINRKFLGRLSLDDRTRMASNGVRLIDDWTISGQQMGGEVMNLHAFGIPRDSVEIDLVCGGDNQLRNGVDGVHCNAYYRYTYDADDPKRVSVTGAHCNTDYGFGEPVDNIWSMVSFLAATTLRYDPGVRHGYERLPSPLLRNVARSYAPARFKEAVRMDSPERLADLDRQVGIFNELMAELRVAPPRPEDPAMGSYA